MAFVILDPNLNINTSELAARVHVSQSSPRNLPGSIGLLALTQKLTLLATQVFIHASLCQWEL